MHSKVRWPALVYYKCVDEKCELTIIGGDDRVGREAEEREGCYYEQLWQIATQCWCQPQFVDVWQWGERGSFREQTPLAVAPQHKHESQSAPLVGVDSHAEDSTSEESGSRAAELAR